MTLRLTPQAAFLVAMRNNPALQPNPHRLAACALLVGATRETLALWAIDLSGMPAMGMLTGKMDRLPALRTGSGHPGRNDKGGHILDAAKCAALTDDCWAWNGDPSRLARLAHPEAWQAFWAAVFARDWAPLLALARAWDPQYPPGTWAVEVLAPHPDYPDVPQYRHWAVISAKTSGTGTVNYVVRDSRDESYAQDSKGQLELAPMVAAFNAKEHYLNPEDCNHDATRHWPSDSWPDWLTEWRAKYDAEEA